MKNFVTVFYVFILYSVTSKACTCITKGDTLKTVNKLKTSKIVFVGRVILKDTIWTKQYPSSVKYTFLILNKKNKTIQVVSNNVNDDACGIEFFVNDEWIVFANNLIYYNLSKKENKTFFSRVYVTNTCTHTSIYTKELFNIYSKENKKFKNEKFLRNSKPNYLSSLRKSKRYKHHHSN